MTSDEGGLSVRHSSSDIRHSPIFPFLLRRGRLHYGSHPPARAAQDGRPGGEWTVADGPPAAPSRVPSPTPPPKPAGRGAKGQWRPAPRRRRPVSAPRPPSARRPPTMSPPPSAKTQPVPPELSDQREIRIYSHSQLFYWWPVWFTAFILTGWTWL